MAGRIARLVQIDAAGTQIFLERSLQGGAALDQRCKMSGQTVQFIVVLNIRVTYANQRNQPLTTAASRRTSV